jgi:hypothetical protein
MARVKILRREVAGAAPAQLISLQLSVWQTTTVTVVLRSTLETDLTFYRSRERIRPRHSEGELA